MMYGITGDQRRGALPMIDRGDIRQAIDRCTQQGCYEPLINVRNIRLTA